MEEEMQNRIIENEEMHQKGENMDAINLEMKK